jgi:hypothetical protein
MAAAVTEEGREAIADGYLKLPRKNYLAINGEVTTKNSVTDLLIAAISNSLGDVMLSFNGMGEVELILDAQAVPGTDFSPGDTDAMQCANHAERKIARKAADEQQTLLGVGASHGVCNQCKTEIRNMSPFAAISPIWGVGKCP